MSDVKVNSYINNVKKRKVLFTATVVKTHINAFHLPYLKWFKEQGYEVHVAAKNDFINEPCVIPNCDKLYDINFARFPFSKFNFKAYRQLKEIISESFLGMEYKYKTQYGDSVEYLNLMYDLQNNPEKTYTNDEIQMLQVLSFIRNEENIFKLKEFATLLMQQEGIRNPITLQTAIAKTKHEQTNILNQGLLGIDKIEAAIEEEKNKEDPSCYKEEIDGVTVYHLNGIEYTVLAHNPIGLDNNDEEIVKQKQERWMNYEGKKGTTNICCEIANSKYKNHGHIGNNFLFTKLNDNMIIGAGKRRYSN